MSAFPQKSVTSRGQLGAAISNLQHSHPDEEELWNTANTATGADRADALVKLILNLRLILLKLQKMKFANTGPRFAMLELAN